MAKTKTKDTSQSRWSVIALFQGEAGLEDSTGSSIPRIGRAMASPVARKVFFTASHVMVALLSSVNPCAGFIRDDSSLESTQPLIDPLDV